jgi:hypothetical protein
MSYRPGPDDTYYEDWALDFSDRDEEPDMHLTPETGGAFLLGALFMLVVLVLTGSLA